jgi:hypothetical protein
MKIYQAVQKLLVGYTQTHTRETGDLISLLSFFESRLIKLKEWYKKVKSNISWKILSTSQAHPE